MANIAYRKTGFGSFSGILASAGTPGFARMLAIVLPIGPSRLITGIAGSHIPNGAGAPIQPAFSRLAICFGGGQLLGDDSDNPLPNGVFQTTFPNRLEDFGFRTIFDQMFNAYAGLTVMFPNPVIIPAEESVIAMISRVDEVQTPAVVATKANINLMGVELGVGAAPNPLYGAYKLR